MKGGQDKMGPEGKAHFGPAGMSWKGFHGLDEASMLKLSCNLCQSTHLSLR